MPFFTRMTLDEAFELLLSQKIIASEFKQASKRINRLKDDDWRLWFGRFLLFVRSDAENYRFTDACICLAEAEKLLTDLNNPEETQKFHSLINRESLFWVFKFYYEATGIASLALLISRFYQNGWGVSADLEKAYEFALEAAKMRETEPIYLMAQETLNSLLLKISDKTKIQV